jgi:hypothetical protein
MRLLPEALRFNILNNASSKGILALACLGIFIGLCLVFRRIQAKRGGALDPCEGGFKKVLLDGNGEKDAKKLLTDIACCSVARQLVDHPNPKHPCSKVVGIQKAKSWKAFQVPEPWSGHLLQAPILFLSSNPGISDWDAYPKGVGGFDLWEFFDCRFEGRWSKDCTKALVAGKKSYKTVAYWANIRNRATELLGTKAMCGKDYALSEMVHCKSVMGEVCSLLSARVPNST